MTRDSSTINGTPPRAAQGLGDGMPGESATGDHSPWEIVCESVGRESVGAKGTSSGAAPADDRAPMRLPPQDIQAERCTLGSCLLLVSALDEVLEILRPEHFYFDAHRIIFAALAEMRSAGKTAIDAVTVLDWIESSGRMQSLTDSYRDGAVALMQDVLESVPHAAHATYYAGMVLDAARRRAAELAAMGILRQTPRKDIATDELLAEAESSLHAVMEDGMSDQPQTIGDVLTEALDEIEHGQPAQKSVPTGWTHLDHLIGGCPKGGLVILAGRPSQGKSACALSIAIEVARQGRAVLFSSYEQTRLELAERALSIWSGLDHRRMMHGQLTESERLQALEAAATLGALPIALDASCRNLSGLATLIRIQVRRRGIELAVVDYLQLIPPDDYRVNREQQVAQISRRLKMLAMQTGVAVICLSQLNREVEKREDKRPRLSDLRESGAIEQDADHVWFIHRPNFYGTASANSCSMGAESIDAVDDHGILTVAKQRNGPTGEVRLAWIKERMQYLDVSPDYGAPVFPGDSPAQDQGELF